MVLKSQLLSLFFLISSFYSGLRAQEYDFVIAKDGSGDFTIVQEVIMAVPDFYIKNGEYKEKLILPASKTLVTFIGEEAADYSLDRIFGDWQPSTTELSTQEGK